MPNSDKPVQPIAIIGMACIFPGAPDLAQYWANITGAVDAISAVPEQRWPGVFYDPNSNEVDRFYCRRGGFVDEYVDFDPLQYGVMPKAAQSADPDQLLSLRVGAEALRDAGYAKREFPREKTGVIIGRGNYLSAGTLRLEQHVRLVQQTLQTLKDLIPSLSAEQLHDVREQLKSKLDYYGPDVAVGMIPNLVASRLANRLDLRGPAYTVDAACASSLIALEQACEALRSGQCDMMLAGGLHFTHDLTFWATFCQLGALSRTQTVRPFSAEADGILAGEGIGMLVLKRAVDAQRDGDRIYALINGVASASDGRSSSLLAPAVEGQILALQRAWQQTGMQPEQIGLVEAHGTGTPAGDLAELETLKQFFGTWQGESGSEPRKPVLGSVKSMIGHTMPAAGVAGVIKAALSLYHGVLPPTLHCESPHELLAQTRFRVLAQAEEWPHSETQQLRVAAVNAFGFGGINAHVVLSAQAQTVGQEAPELAENPPSLLPKVVTIAAETQEILLLRLQAQRWDAEPGHGPWRLAIIEPNEQRLALALKVVGKGVAWHGRNQIYFSHDGMIAQGGKVAFLFAGVDSSFEPQAADVANYFHWPQPRYCRTLDPAQELGQVVLGIGELNLLIFKALQQLRVQADGMAGHSIGEWSAMSAANMVAQERIDAVMSGLANDPASLEVPDVLFLAAACSVDTALPVLRGLSDIGFSHDNCPHQVILCGKPAAIEIAQQRLRELNVLAQPLPIVSGFHSPLFAGHMQPYEDFYLNNELREPDVPLWSATTAQLYPSSMQAKQQLALRHLLETVQFRQMLENMYADGYRAFVQVGTGSLLGFVDDTLKGQAHLSIASNIAKRSGMAQLCHLIAAFWVEGADVDLSLLTGDAQPESQIRTAKNSIKLRLGVPLISLDRPLQVPSALTAQGMAATLPLSALATQDPLQQLFEETLASIQQASLDVQTCWRERQTPLHNAQPKTRKQPIVSPASSAPPVSTLPDAAYTSVETLEPVVSPVMPFRKTLRQHLDVLSNIPLVLDHAFYPQRADWPVIADRHPVIPLTMEIMLLREAVERELPGFVVIRIEDIHAFNWLIVEAPTDINIHVQLSKFPEIEVEIEGYIKAKVIIDRQYPQPPMRVDGRRGGVFERRNRGGEAERGPRFINQRETAINARELYEDHWMFHGPAYQGVIQLGPIGENGIAGRLKTTAGKGALLDNMGQLSGYWVMEQDVDCLAMPIGVSKVSFFGPDPLEGTEFDCQSWVRNLDDISCVTDLQLIDANGRTLISMEGWQTRRYQMDRDFWMHTKQIEHHLVSKKLEDGVVLFHDRYDTAIMRDYMARRFLNQPEMAEYANISPRRRRQWLNGRLAAKDAVRRFLWERHGADKQIYPKELRISNTAQGQPLVNAHISLCFNESLHISIAHKDLFAVAIAAEKPVGVDIEKIEPRTQAFADLTFSAEEQALLSAENRDEWLARCWVAKEVVAKMSGAGLEGKPKQFVIDCIEGERLRVNQHWVNTRRNDNYIIGWAI